MKKYEVTAIPKINLWSPANYYYHTSCKVNAKNKKQATLLGLKKLRSKQRKNNASIFLKLVSINEVA